VIVLWTNQKDVEHDMAKEVRACVQFVFARTVLDVFNAASLGSLPRHGLDTHLFVESRL
jgi:hypothetical protein